MNNRHEELSETHISNEIFCFWFTPTLDKGYKQRELKLTDLQPLPSSLKCNTKQVDQLLYNIQTEISQTLKNNINELTNNQKYIILIKLILKEYYLTIIILGILKLLSILCAFAGPILLGRIVTYVSQTNTTTDLTYGIFLTLLLTISIFISASLNTLYNIKGHILHNKIKLLLSLVLFKQILILPSYICTELELTEAKAINILQVDIDCISSCIKSCHDIWSLPLQLLIAFILLYVQVKIAFLAGIVIIILTIPLNSYIANRINIATNNMMLYKDIRINILTNSIKYIKSIKILVLETFVLEQINNQRKFEIQNLSIRKYLDAICVFLWAFTPCLVPGITFIVTVYIGVKLSPGQVYSILLQYIWCINPLYT